MKSVSLPRQSRTKTTLVNLVFSYASLGLLLVHGLVLTPVYLARIPVELFGGWLASGAVLASLELIDPGVGQIIQQRTASALGRHETLRLREVVGTGMAVSMLLSLVPLAVLPLTGYVPAIVGLADGPEALELTRAAAVGVAATAAGIAASGISATGIGLQLATYTGVVYVSGGVFSIAVTLVLLTQGLGVTSIPAGLLARGVFVLTANVIGVSLWSRLRLGGMPRIAKAEARSVFSIGWVTLGARVGSGVIGKLDSLIASRWFGPEQATVLALTGRAADLVRLLAERVSQSAAPGMAHLIGEASNRAAGTAGRLIVIVSCLVAVGMGSVAAANHLFVNVWVGSSLYGGELLSGVLALAAGTAVLSTALHQFLIASGGITRSARIILLEAVAKVGLQIAFARVFGLVGVPAATLVATSASLVWLLPKAMEAEGFRWRQGARWLSNAAVRLYVGVGLGSGGGLALAATLRIDPSWSALVVLGATWAVIQALVCVAPPSVRSELSAVVSDVIRAARPARKASSESVRRT